MNGGAQIPVHEFMIALLRLRCDPKISEDAVCQRVLKRLVHHWCQAVEEQLPHHLQSTCPDCTLSAKYHPFQRSSRAKGNRSLQMSLVSKFQARSAGYISMKNEDFERFELGESTVQAWNQNSPRIHHPTSDENIILDSKSLQ